MKILTVFGTRPEAIKLAPVLRELARRANGLSGGNGDRGIQSIVCVTAQHRRMLDQVLTLFGIRPQYDLDIMAEGQTLAQVGAAIFAGLGPILQSEKPDWVIVQGDTTSAAIAALTGFYCGAKVAHVEAGLRTGDKGQPFPEEINRRITTISADLHLAPTAAARNNLLGEGVADDAIRVTGNPVIDALHWASAQAPSSSVQQLLAACGVCAEAGNGMGRDSFGPAKRLVLVTAHRRENFGAPLQHIAAALRELAHRYNGQVQIVYPVHPNPNVRTVVERELSGVAAIRLIEPLDYLDLVQLMKHSYLVLTDSGGIQEEAPSLGKPVLVLREVTERPEAVTAGTVKLVGTDRERILSQAIRLLDSSSEYRAMSEAVNPYGDGLASKRIAAALLGESSEPFRAATPVSKGAFAGAGGLS